MTNPGIMTVISATETGGPEVLCANTTLIPQPGEDELLIRVSAAGVNRPDILQRQGLYPPPKGASEILGLEIAGEVVACGSGVQRFAEGDTVCALVSGGGYASYCVVPEATALPIPAGLDHVQAASLPETFFTVWHNVFERAQLRPGEVFLVHGGTSGIGITAIQMAKAFGARVFTTARTAEKCAFCEQLGTERAINYTEEDFVKVIKDATNGRGANVILDMVGGDYIDRNIKVAAEDGRINQIAFLRGSKAEVDFMRLMLKRITLTGSTLRARPLAVKAQIAAALEEKVWPLIASGVIKPVIDSTYPLDQAADAHRRMESSAHIGKIVLTVEH